MGKRKKGGKVKFDKSKKTTYGSDDERNFENEKAPNKKDTSFYHDEVDLFHENRDKILLDSAAERQQDDDSSDNEDEVLGLNSDSEDDGAIAEYERQLKKFKSYDFKDEIASDLDEEQEDTVDDKAWGSARNIFYGADVGDSLKIDSEDEDNTALLEEQEALAIQKRMTEELDEQDFDLDIFKTVEKKESKKSDVTSSTQQELEERIEKDLSTLTKAEKLKILNKESPELLQLIDDYKEKLKELTDRVLPLQKLVRSGKVPKGNGAYYIEAKVKLYLNYCINISFYVMMKAKRSPVENHPVIKRILQYRNLIKQIDAIDRKVSYDDLLQEVQTKEENVAPEEKDEESEEEDKELEKEVAADDESGVDDVQDLQEEQGEEGKRAITYQIAKNKGLTPHRKKEQRNPRVKHREKYRKAKIRRKGQVREVRKEIQKYGGEISGIKAGISKSRKFKS